MILLKNSSEKENKELVVSIQIFAQVLLSILLLFAAVQFRDGASFEIVIITVFLSLSVGLNATRQALKLSKDKY